MTCVDPKVVIFLGPSLPIEAASKILNADYRAPARQADILSCVLNNEADVILLIDGEFGQSLSVWHKEILYALESGVHILGSASMGALRAAESHSFGMVGLGKIFENYRDGLLYDDDVALTYAPRELKYENLTIPMVNITATLKDLVNKSYIDQSLSDSVEEALRGINFSQRTEDRCRTLLCDLCLSEVSQELFGEKFIDQKSLDATDSIYYVKDHLAEYSKKYSSNFIMESTYCFQVLMEQDRWLGIGDLRHRDLSKHLSIHSLDFETINADALRRELCLSLCRAMSISVTEREIEETVLSWRRVTGTQSIDDEIKWMAENCLSLQEFQELMEEEAILKKGSQWLLAQRGERENTAPLLKYLKLTGRYSKWLTQLKNVQDTVDILPRSRAERDRCSVSDLLATHLTVTDQNLGSNLDAWMMERGFADSSDLEFTLRRSIGAKLRIAELAASLFKI